MVDEIKIMQLADGTLPTEERDSVQKAIDSDPKLKALFEDYQKTGDLLFNLGDQLKSVSVPAHIQEKINSIKTEKKETENKTFNFNFLNIFKMQYAGVAAAITIVFGAGFSTSNLMVAKKSESENQIVSLSKESNIKFRGNFKNDTDLSERVVNLYNFINEGQLTSEFNSVHSSLRKGDVFNLKSKDVNGRLIEFEYLGESNRQEINCKTISYSAPIELNQIDKGTNVKLEFCNVEGLYQLASINLI